MTTRRVRRGFAPVESEAVFQVRVKQLALYNGWRCFHPPDNRPSRNTGRVQDVAPGFPDWTLVRGPRLVFAELKAEKGRFGPGQLEWLADLQAVGGAVSRLRDLAVGAFVAVEADIQRSMVETSVEAYEWRPSDWPEIERVLARPPWRATPVEA